VFVTRVKSLLEVVGEAYVNTTSRAGWKTTANHSESECEVVTEGIISDDLSLKLASTQIEIVGNATENFDS
jgi:hypothetical protein